MVMGFLSMAEEKQQVGYKKIHTYFYVERKKNPCKIISDLTMTWREKYHKFWDLDGML